MSYSVQGRFCCVLYFVFSVSFSWFYCSSFYLVSVFSVVCSSLSVFHASFCPFFHISSFVSGWMRTLECAYMNMNFWLSCRAAICNSLGRSGISILFAHHNIAKMRKIWLDISIEHVSINMWICVVFRSWSNWGLRTCFRTKTLYSNGVEIKFCRPCALDPFSFVMNNICFLISLSYYKMMFLWMAFSNICDISSVCIVNVGFFSGDCRLQSFSIRRRLSSHRFHFLWVDLSDCLSVCSNILSNKKDRRIYRQSYGMTFCFLSMAFGCWLGSRALQLGHCCYHCCCYCFALLCSAWLYHICLSVCMRMFWEEAFKTVACVNCHQIYLIARFVLIGLGL